MSIHTAQLPVTRSRGRGRLTVAIAGIGYVLAWLVGLISAPSSPSAGTGTNAVQRYFTEHRGAALGQSWLVHGLAGIALVIITVAVVRRLTGRARGTAAAAGFAAAAVSLTQVVFMELLSGHVRDGGGAAGTARWFDAINYADTVKLALLGVLVGSVTWAARSARFLPGWLLWVGAVLAPLLPISGLAFPLHSDALYGALYLSLPLLLVWVGAISVVLSRSARLGA